MATAFYGGPFFGGEFFSESGVKTGTGGIDPKGRGRRIVKPSGLEAPRKRKTLTLPEGRKTVDERALQAAELAVQTAKQLREEFEQRTEPLPQVPLISMMPPEAIDMEIGQRLRRKLRKDEEELLMILIIARASSR
jgi:hypothetical protein